MKKLAICLVALLGLPLAAQACGGLAQKTRCVVKNTAYTLTHPLNRVKAKTVAVAVQPPVVLVPAPQSPPPKPMPSAAPKATTPPLIKPKAPVTYYMVPPAVVTKSTTIQRTRSGWFIP